MGNLARFGFPASSCPTSCGRCCSPTVGSASSALAAPFWDLASVRTTSPGRRSPGRLRPAGRGVLPRARGTELICPGCISPGWLRVGMPDAHLSRSCVQRVGRTRGQVERTLAARLQSCRFCRSLGARDVGVGETSSSLSAWRRPAYLRVPHGKVVPNPAGPHTEAPRFPSLPPKMQTASPRAWGALYL